MLDIPVFLRINTPIKEDTRPFFFVTLVDAKRPMYREAFCFNCGDRLCQIEGATVIGITDVDDMSFGDGKPRLAVRCQGRHCRTLYRFTIN